MAQAAQKSDRAARSARARAAGNARAKAEANKIVIHEKPEAQIARALANVKAAELSPGAKLAHERAEQRKAEALRASLASQNASSSVTTSRRRASVAETHPEPVDFDIDKSIREMSTEHIECRDLRHSWRPFSARWISKENHYEDILRCGRCGTERIRRINSRGQIISASYAYAEGYVMLGSGRFTGDMNASLRLASLQTRLVHDSVQE